MRWQQGVKPPWYWPIDFGRPLARGLAFSSRFNNGAGSTLTDVGPYGLHGTLTNLAPGYTCSVSGGSPSGVNGSYSPVGSVWRNSTYEIAEDWMGGPGSWVLYPIGGDQMMDGLYWGNGAATPWDATWGTVAVSQGALAPGPWLADGIGLTSAPGYITIATNASAEPGTGDFSVVLDYTYTNTAWDGQAAVLFQWTGGGKQIMLHRWPTDGSNWATCRLRLYMTDGTNSLTTDFTGSETAWTLDTRRIVDVAFDRDANAKLYIDGSYVSQIDISSVSGALSGMGTLYLGTRSELYPTWSVQGRMHGLHYYKRALPADEFAQLYRASRDGYDPLAFEPLTANVFLMATGATTQALAGDAEAVAEATGALLVDRKLAGEAGAIAGATGALLVDRRLAGEAGAVAQATGNLTIPSSGIQELAGEAAAIAEATGDLQPRRTLAGEADAVAEATGDLLVRRALAGDAVAEISATGALIVHRALAGAAEAAVSATAQLVVPVALDDIAGTLTDVVQMPDGEVFVGRMGGDSPLLQLLSGRRVPMAELNGRVMSRLAECEVDEVVAPAEAGTVDGVWALHPSGWALARAGSVVQLWRYASGVWTVAGARDLAGTDLYDSEWRISLVSMGGEIYVVGWAHLVALQPRGTALVETTSGAMAEALAELATLRGQGVQWGGGRAGTMADGYGAAERWRGRWYGMSEGWLCYWDGEGLRRVAEMGGVEWGWMIAEATGLQMFGATSDATMQPWASYASQVAAVHDGPVQYIVAGHRTGEQIWMLGRGDVEDATSQEWRICRIELAGHLVPALYELRQSGGSDAATASPQLYEIRQGAGRQGYVTIRLLELRQYAGSDVTTASPGLYELRQWAGEDAAAESPELHEIRQYASAEMPETPRVFELRQYAGGVNRPGATELVRFYVGVSAPSHGEASAIQVTSNGLPAEDAGLRVLARAGQEELAPEAWDSYERVSLGYKHELEHPGETVRVAVFKPAAAAVPEIGILTRREGD